MFFLFFYFFYVEKEKDEGEKRFKFGARSGHKTELVLGV